MAIDINVPSQVKTYANLAAFPVTGTLKTIFIAEDTNKTYRWTGSVYVEVSAAGASGITIGTTAITSGTVGRVLFEGTGNVVQESANLFWDNTNGRLGIGTSTPTTKINIVTPNNGDALRLEVPSTNSTVYDFYLGNSDNTAYIRANSRILELRRQGQSSTIRTVGGGLNDLALQAGGGITFTTYDTNERMRIIGSTGNVLINTTTDAGFKLDVNGTARVLGNTTFGGTLSVGGGYNVTSGTFNIIQNSIGINPTSGTMAVNGYTFTGTINQTGGANGITRGLLISPTLTSAFDFRAIETTVGKVCFNTTSGNTLIGTTTDAGFKLDVNGTARVKGASNISTTTAFTIANSDSTNLLQVQDNGYIRIGSQGTSAFRVYATDASGDSEPSGLNLVLNSRVVSQSTAAGIGMVTINGIAGTATTGNQSVFLISKGFSPTSGTATYTATSIIPTINQTGGANGAVKGFYYNPTVTSVLGTHHAFHSTSGRIRFENLPTSPAGLSSGDVWNNLGILTIV